MKKRLISIGSVLLTLFILTITIYAAELPDLSRAGSISITTTYQEEIVPGGSLTLYRVAEVCRNDGDYGFRYVARYADCQISLGNITSAKTARELADYTADAAMEGVVGEIDDKGQVVFRDLELGLYLLVQEDAAEGYEIVNPFLVTVPMMEDGEYVYDVDASPKLELEKEPSRPDRPGKPDKPDTPPEEPETPPEEPEIPPEEPETPPEEPKLPQTGLNNWPIPVLALSGVFLVMLGSWLRLSGRKRDHES